ncbi:MAG: 23S rRNA (adenine(2503)-C(2))-methyltransferase RlmN [Flavobacteriales bacterium]|nr:23S rRNA (adenine(2503)-C(2))-methyltransferase RlmN [Flavobacteriales bacterium]
MNKLRPDIRSLSKLQIEDFFSLNNKPKFRANQVYEWLWKHRVLDFNLMTSLSIDDRLLLDSTFSINSLTLHDYKSSLDGTVKFLFQLNQNKVVEGVLIPHRNRYTACISSQAGCSLACTFCATGKLKLYKNLSAGEIYDQVFLINEFSLRKFNKPITNIVYMGMGEPFLNSTNVLNSISHITSKQGLNISAKRITVSTAGIVKIIKRIADLNPKFNLAISLHSANDKVRTKIMEINKSNSLKDLAIAIDYFYHKTKIKPTYEYILLNGINDSIQDAKDLIDFCKKTPSKVNLIEYNQVANIPYQKSSKRSTKIFMDLLEKNKILVKFRRSRGEDIGAACGQLATQNKK